jgi:hypothetical protein
VSDRATLFAHGKIAPLAPAVASFERFERAYKAMQMLAKKSSVRSVK